MLVCNQCRRIRWTTLKNQSLNLSNTYIAEDAWEHQHRGYNRAATVEGRNKQAVERNRREHQRRDSELAADKTAVEL